MKIQITDSISENLTDSHLESTLNRTEKMKKRRRSLTHKSTQKLKVKTDRTDSPYIYCTGRVSPGQLNNSDREGKIALGGKKGAINIHNKTNND